MIQKNIRYVIAIIACLIFITACKESAVPKPDNLLSKQKMADVLYDITIINALKGVDKKTIEETSYHLDSYLYAKHEIDSAQFSDSNNYYAANPMEYDEIFGMVEKRITDNRDIVAKEMDAEQARRDSLQKQKIAERRKNDTLPKPKFNVDKKRDQKKEN